MPVKLLLSEGTAIWSARIAVLVAAIEAVLALITGISGTHFFFGAAASTLLLASIVSMLFAIYPVVILIYFHLRQRG
jgi:hypothetical protein